MNTILVTHPRINQWGGPDKLEEACQRIRPLLAGMKVIVTTGVPRSDAVGQALSQLTELPVEFIFQLGPLTAWPLPRFFDGMFFHSLIRSRLVAQSAFGLWSVGGLPICESPTRFIRRVEAGLKELEEKPASLAIIHREVEMAIRVILGEARTLLEATQIKGGIGHLEVRHYWK